MNDKITDGKKKTVNYYIERLYKIIENSMRRKKYETALETIATCAELEYQWNQFHVDERLEQSLRDVGQMILNPSFGKEDLDAQTVLFYDGFGYDNRGLMLNYVEGLLALGYRVVYVTSAAVRKKQPTLERISKNKNIVWEYLSFPQPYLGLIESLDSIFVRYRPAKAFLYILPYDVAGIAVFLNYQGIVERYQINLTDHAFWLGKYAFDYCVEFRDYGASISRMYRGIDPAKLIKIPLTPYVDDTLSFEGFPFEAEGHKVVFSGGGLYKTFDSENTYYKLVEAILRYDAQVIFLYAGSGDDSELKKLIEKFPGRVWHIQERRDLYQLMKHVYFYLNTYPLLGGLMTQYAALAGKVPVTVGNGDVSEGFLVNRDDCQYMFRNTEEALEEIYKLLNHQEYAKQKGQRLQQEITGKKEFRDALGKVITEHISSYEIQEADVDINHFTEEYLFRFRLKEIQRVIIKDEHWELRKIFPLLFFRKRLRNLIHCLKKG